MRHVPLSGKRPSFYTGLDSMRPTADRDTTITGATHYRMATTGSLDPPDLSASVERDVPIGHTVHCLITAFLGVTFVN